MKKYEDRIEALLAQMTLEEKVGQLQQCGPSLVGAFEVSFEELLDMMFDGRISQEEFGRLMSTAEEDFHEEDLRAGRIGSYNGIKNAATANKLQKIAVEETRLGIPLIFGYDVIHGYRSITPIPLAESCAWDEKLWQRTARMAAKEATAAGVHMTFAPMVDVAKDARWGRISEGAGEDTLLAAKYGAAKVRGFQGEDLTKEDSMVACVKHFAAYGAAEAGKDYNRVDMSTQRLFEEYLPPFKACVDAGARSLMPAFNDISGVPCSVNKWLLTDVLRKDWGFDGMLVSDANAIAECVNHGIAVDKKDAARQALQAGLNMDMTSNSYSEHMVALVEEGTVPVEVLDEAVRGILRVKFEAGLFDNPYQTSEEREAAELVTEDDRALALEAAEKSIVLLKNENVLPFKEGTKLGILGTLAEQAGEMTGAWAIGANPEDCVSLIAACEAQKISYTYEAGMDREKIRNLAAVSDVLLLTLGETKDMSGEAASRSDITLPKEQQELFEYAVTLGKPVIVVLFNGRPLAMPEIKEGADAILEAWHPGIEAGNAILNILFGKVNPSAKLTTTFPYATGQCPIYYDHMNTGRPGGKGKFTSKYLDTPLEPLYPFGYGLSYTTYEYDKLQAEFADITEKAEATEKTDVISGILKVSVQVTNTGDRAGEEIVQLYVQDVAAQRVRPVKQLKAFEKISLAAGESRIVSFEIPVKQLGYYDMQMNHLVEKGLFKVYAGGNSADCLCCEVEL